MMESLNQSADFSNESYTCVCQAPVYVAIPHCTPRTSAISREPVVKAEVDGAWVELRSKEVTFDERKVSLRQHVDRSVLGVWSM